MLESYISRWMLFSEALDHLDTADLLAAQHDGVVAARFADNCEKIDAGKWSPDIGLIDGSKPLLGEDRGIELCRAQVEELALKTKGPVRARVPATEATLIVANEPSGVNWRTVPADPTYPIRERHTAYEWSMALGGAVHP